MSGDATSGASGPTPAGWYDDPSGGAGSRWWDGAQWTGHIREPLMPAPLPPVAAPPTIPGPAPMQAAPVLQAHRIGVGTEDTRAAWWIAFSPLWSIVGQAAVVATIMSILNNQLGAYIPTLVVTNIVLWAAVLGLAFLDRSKLQAEGNASAASPFWVLLTPLAYLIARAQHVRMYATGAWTVVVWWCIAMFLAPGIAVLAVFAAYGIFAV
jgi:Protein of unknown function (DUF2510)